MVDEKQSTVQAVTNIATGRGSANHSWIRWVIVLASVVCIGVCFVVVQFLLRSSQLEHEIRLDLITNGDIDDGARISVLNELKLYSFYSRFGPQRFATLCIQTAEGNRYLAYARCWREGMMWRSKSDRWKTVPAWPTFEEIRAFEKEQADIIAIAVNDGYLPRPPGTEGFQLLHLSIQVSEAVPGFEPNDAIDSAVFADGLKRGIVPSGFAFATFHQPRWRSAQDGVEAIEESIRSLMRMSNSPECRQMDCEGFLKLLHLVKERLVRAEELGLDFYFLAEDN